MKSTIFIVVPLILTLFNSIPIGLAQSPAPVFLSPTPAPAPAPAFVDLADLLSVAGPFGTFLNYLIQTNVIETFQRQANDTKVGITIFVPKDSAFSSLKKTTFSNLTQDQLKSLLLYHAFPKYYSLAEFKNLSALNPSATFAGSPYNLNLTDNMGTIRVQSMWSNPKITSSVYSTRPVAVYEIDKVLLPLQLFSTDPPLAPAPAPAPESKASDLAPSKSATGSKPKTADSTGAGTYAISASYYLPLVVSGGVMLML